MLRNKGKGQGLVEFALILPILLLLLLGIIEGARIIWAYVTVQNAAREATRYAVTGRPFACGGDPDDRTTGTLGDGDASNPAHFCDDSTRGDPWSPQVPTMTRVAAIKNVAVAQGRNLAVSRFAMANLDEYNLFRDPTASDASGVFGIAVIGQSAVFTQGMGNFGGEPGWNVRVETYYNVEMIDPIFNVLMGRLPIHLAGQVELQNEGIDTTVQEYIGGIQFQSDNCAALGTCGSGQTPYISIQDDFGDFTEPAGGQFTVSVNDHLPNTAYKIWFVHKDGPQVHSQSIDITTDSLGGKLVTFIISVTAPQGVDTYKIYTSLTSDGSNAPVATCLGDGAANAPCFSVEVGNPTLTVSNINDPDTDQQSQPDDPARWPISSSIPIYLYQHDLNTNYPITFNGQPATAMPGSFLFEGNPVTQIRTDSEFGANLNGSPAYYIATGHTSGSSLVVSSGVATATLDFSRARITIAGETDVITTTHPQDDVVGIVLRDLAPRQQYQIFVDDGVSASEIKRATDAGVVALSYRVPYASHTPGDPARTVEIFAYDYGRGINTNKIASRYLWLYTPINPYINVPGGARWPAGSPITVQLRRHEYNPPLGPDYEVYIQQGPADNPTFSQLIASVTTDQNPSTLLGEKDVDYTIPFNFTGSYIIRSFRPGDLDVPVASFEIVVTANPTIRIDNGNRWPPRSEITIRLLGHAANTPYDVWLDRGGSQEDFLETVVTDENGETTVDYTIPQTMPTRIDPDFYPIYSYLNNTVTADDGRLEVVPADLRITNIVVPNVTFDIQVPVTVTIRNDSAVTITDTYFDSDLYIDPAAAPSLGSPLPPGQYKTWLNNVPPSSTVTYDEEIVLFGQQSHQIYGRVDTSDGVAESNEGNNLYLKTIDAACPVEISDEFEGDGLTEWTPTDFGDSGPSCNAPADLPPLNTGSTLLEMRWPNNSTVNSGYPNGTVNLVRGFLGDGSPSTYGFARSGSYGNPNYSLYVGPHGSTGNSSAGVAIQFTNTEPNVTINFDYGTYYRDLEPDDISRYYFRLDGVSYTEAGQGTFLIEETPGGNNVDKNPTVWFTFSRTFDLSPGTHTMVFGAHVPANIENDNERAYMYLDNLVVSEAPSASGPPANPTGTLWSAHFNSDEELFSFAKDTFTIPSTREPDTPSTDTESSGSRVTDTGSWVDGALQVQLGQSTSGENMSGGWTRPFTVATVGNCVTIQGYYRIHFPFNTYEGASEYGEVLLSVDNALPQVIFTTQSLSDGGQNYDSGWVPFSVTLPNMAAGDHTLVLGGFNNQSSATDERMEVWFDDVYVVESTPGATTSVQTESANVLTLTNYGSSALTGDDNGSGAGYHLFHRPVGSGPFEVYVRVNQPAQGLAGLEIRSSAADGAAAKLMFGYTSDGRVKIYSRAAGSGLTVDENTDTIGNNPSVWLRLRRNGDEFVFYYVVSNSDTPPTNWGTAMYTIQNFTLPDSVEVGLINAPNDSSGTLRNAEFKHFHLCATSAPGGAGSGGQGYLGSRCGQVEENGNGLVVIDAVNTVLNQSGGGVWQTVSVNNVLGEPSLEGLEATNSRPHATYQANIETSATFYVWVAGWTAASGHAGVDVGRNGSVIGTVTGFPSVAAAPGWVRMPGSVSLTNGIYTFDLWANAGNVRVFKLLLTNSSTFVPPPDGMAQSACTVIAEPHVPPLLRVCVDPIRRGDFEGTFNEVTGEWSATGRSNVYSSSSYEGNRGAVLPNYSGFRPAISQLIQLPSWILTNTTAILNVRVGVDLLPGLNSGSDMLVATLRRAADNFDLITPTVVLADGDFSDESPTPPEFDATNPEREDWRLKNVDIYANLNPLSVLEAGDSVEFTLYSPNAGQGTFFYVDNISLTFCTTQPEPVQQADLGRITGRAQRSGAPLAGARVWAYAFADEGSQPGPVAETYSIQDGSYRFYNLQPGRYLVYSEITDASGTFSDVRLVEVRPGTEVRNVILNLQTG